MSFLRIYKSSEIAIGVLPPAVLLHSFLSYQYDAIQKLLWGLTPL